MHPCSLSLCLHMNTEGQLEVEQGICLHARRTWATHTQTNKAELINAHPVYRLSFREHYMIFSLRVHEICSFILFIINSFAHSISQFHPFKC